MRLKNRVALITGAGSGQGKETALLFAEEGASVVVADWNEENGRQVEQEIISKGQEAFFVRVDVAEEEMVVDMTRKVIGKYGKIDILFNNAGIGYSANARYTMAPLLDTPSADWRSIIEINLTGAYLVTKHVVPYMIESKSGSIINNASINGIIGMTGADAYTAAKGGLVALSRTMAIDYGQYNIRVNCICPGFIDTPMMGSMKQNKKMKAYYSSNLLGRFGTPEEVAKVVLFLASDDSSYLTGLIMPVDGGWSIKGTEAANGF